MGIVTAHQLAGGTASTRLELVERHPALAKFVGIFVPGVFSILGDYALVFDEEALRAFCAAKMLGDDR